MAKDDYETTVCSACGGCGTIEESIDDDDTMVVDVECAVCGGTGEC